MEQFDPKTLKPNEVNVGTLEAPKIQTYAPVSPTQVNVPAISPSVTTDVIGTRPVTLAPTIPTTGEQGLEQYIASNSASMTALQKEQQALQQDQEKLVSKDKSAISSLYEKMFGQADRNEQIYEDQGVDDAKRQSDEYTSQIEAEQLANRRQIEDLTRNNKNGLFGGGLQDEVNRLNRESVSKQADLAILQSAANRRYDTAAAIADRKIQVETEGLKTQLDAIKFFYNENKGDLTKTEDRLYQQKITELDREYKETYENKKAIQSMVIDAAQGGAPNSVLQQAQKAQTVEEAAALLSRYSLDAQAKRATIANTYSTISARNAAANSVGVNPKVLATTQFKAAQNAQLLKQELNKAIANVEKYGNFESINGEGKGALNNSKVQLRSLLSTALEQGVVQPGEAPAFEKAIGSINESRFIRNSVTLGALKAALGTAESKYNGQATALEGIYGVTKDKLNALTGDTSLPAQEFDDMEALID